MTRLSARIRILAPAPSPVTTTARDKHPTIIEDDVRIGSDTMLVAPVRVGKGSVTAAGSVVTEDVPPNTLVAGVPAVVKKKLQEQ